MFHVPVRPPISRRPYKVGISCVLTGVCCPVNEILAQPRHESGLNTNGNTTGLTSMLNNIAGLIVIFPAKNPLIDGANRFGPVPREDILLLRSLVVSVQLPLEYRRDWPNIGSAKKHDGSSSLE
jgi:hypothetical protein